MKQQDFLICTFVGDTATPPVTFAGEIISIDTEERSFVLRLSDSGQEMTFRYDLDPWSGADASGATYTLATHDIYTSGMTDPAPANVAVVTFDDGRRWIGYVDSVSPTTDVVFYHYPSPKISISDNSITASDWEQYPVGSGVASVEGFVFTDALPEDEAVPQAGSSAGGTTATGPFLIIDLYRGDLGGKPKWEVLAATDHFYGAIIKATESTRYSGVDWFKKHWPLLRDAGGDRYGSSWFRGAYHFLKFNADGAAQADYYLKTIDDAGGWESGDIYPIVDVELGGDSNSNHDASAQQIIDCTTAFADRIRAVTDRNVILYGRGAMRDKQINSKMGCDAVWNPSYTKTMVINGLQAWTLDDIVLWQYCGDGKANIEDPKYPHTIPGFGDVDISVYIDGARRTTLDSMIRRLGMG